MTTAERNKLVEDHLWLPTYIVRRKMANRWLWPVGDEKDAIQIGCMVMIKAAGLYDPSLGFKFSTYAFRSIYVVLNKHLNRGGLIKEPSTDFKYRDDERTVLVNKTRNLTYLGSEYPRRDNDSGNWIVDGHDEIGQKEQEEEQAARIRQVWRLLALLPERLQLVIDMRFMKGLTLEKISKIMKVSRERVRQLESQALTKLRNLADEETHNQESSRQKAHEQWLRMWKEA